MNEDNIPKTQIEAIRYFADPANCHSFISALRWADGVVKCSHCGSDKVGKFSGKRLVSNCKSCKKQFTIKTGTIFEDSALGLDKWLPAVWMIVNAKNGISSCELHRSLGVTQKTAWFMSHRIRLAIHEGSFNKMTGMVEADETFIGGKARFMHFDKKDGIKTGGNHMTAVMGLLERGTRDKASRVKVGVLKTRKKSELQGNVRKYVLKDSNVLTDALSSYDGLSADYVHEVIDHAKSYVNGHVHTNGLENFWALLKRSIKGTHVHVADFHLFRYLDEQAYKYNERKTEDSDRFVSALAGVVNRRITYKQLIGRDAE